MSRYYNLKFLTYVVIQIKKVKKYAQYMKKSRTEKMLLNKSQKIEENNIILRIIWNHSL